MLGLFSLHRFNMTTDLISEREWAVVNGNAKFSRAIRPIQVELCELRSFRLSDDSNQVRVFSNRALDIPSSAFELRLGKGPNFEAFKWRKFPDN